MPTPWTTRIWQEFRAGNLTRAYRDVLLTLHTFRGTGGACWPSHETLADRANCCTKTVQRALRQARELDLIRWVERRVRVGWRWLQTSNLYTFTTPAGPVQAGMRAPRTARVALTDIRAGEGRASKKEALEERCGRRPGLPTCWRCGGRRWRRGLRGRRAGAMELDRLGRHVGAGSRHDELPAAPDLARDRVRSARPDRGRQRWRSPSGHRSDGWYCVVRGARFGPWSDRAIAENVMKVEQRRKVV
jgi:hypothetical protein